MMPAGAHSTSEKSNEKSMAPTCNGSPHRELARVSPVTTILLEVE